MRIAIIDKDKCKAGVDCPYICMSACPVNRLKSECIQKSDDKVAIDENLCIGCNICVKKCPFGAISIINLPNAINEDPLYQYGENGFRVFNLPTPRFGEVTGLLGRNGIGKSTVLKILSGVITPNFGKNDVSKDEVISHFQGSESMDYFKKLYSNDIKVVYKVQDVNLIAKAYKGKTVRELLTQVDEREMFEYVVRELGLKHILESDVSQISGGELQRLAIAATFIQKADLYFIDEPSSFLDINQRLKVSRFIQNLSSDDVAIMVVEHDLIMLDFISDKIYVLYGEPTKYGICSMLKGTRAGINEYVAGFLKEENMRIRAKPLVFDKLSFNKKAHTDILLNYTPLEKSYNIFKLSSDEGKIHKKHVVGVIGENATGKTTFVRILANDIKSDSGSVELEEDPKISYKPQYLEVKEDMLVLQFIEPALKYTELIRPLELDALFTKKLSELSGGELQKVMIVNCLSKDASIFLIDEPSAYLDVEQRLIVSKAIRNFIDLNEKTVVVVDHDLLFIDYLCDDIIVFDGVPSRSGFANAPVEMAVGMNSFLKKLNISMRREQETKRPRINKLDSVKDKAQKSKGVYYE